MAIELEYKLEVRDEAALAEILRDADIATLSFGSWQETQMKTTYYDNAAHEFHARRWTLRHRLEGENSVVCLKTPVPEKAVGAHMRREYEVRADAVSEDAIAQLIAVGAPQELLALYHSSPIAPICGAQFLRRSICLRFRDGSTAELAGDDGYLRGRTQILPFTELELELLSGKPEEMQAFAKQLCERYKLYPQAKSKQARAAKLR
ncbi:MAG: CYTH domain-containing protein [Oscillospiraceae bacterium]|jgi:inorganic triphosphatase YgiF|nr:CYTH domain-containing protein [Oscillospiraceae bacterium]